MSPHLVHKDISLHLRFLRHRDKRTSDLNQSAATRKPEVQTELLDNNIETLDHSRPEINRLFIKAFESIKNNLLAGDSLEHGMLWLIGSNFPLA